MADAESNLLLWDYRPIHEQQRHRPYVQRRIHTHSDELSEKNKERYRLLAENSWNYGSYDDQGKLASQIMATPFAIDFHGTSYPMAGIGFVASYPEYRSQGRIDRIMRRILEDCYEQGIVLS